MTITRKNTRCKPMRGFGCRVSKSSLGTTIIPECARRFIESNRVFVFGKRKYVDSTRIKPLTYEQAQICLNNGEIIGLDCDSDILCLDVDVPEIGNALFQCQFEGALVTTSPRGGKHFWFAIPAVFEQHSGLPPLLPLLRE